MRRLPSGEQRARVDHPHLRRLLERGDIEGFVIALEPLCWRLVRSTSASHHDDEDLMQDARLAAMRAGRTFRLDGGANPLSWATRVIQNELWRVAQRDMTVGRRGALDAARLDQPLGADTAATLGQVTAVAGASVEDTVVARSEFTDLVDRAKRMPPRRRAAAAGIIFGSSEPQTVSVRSNRTHALRELTHPLDREPDHRTVFVSRNVHPSTEAAAREAERLLPGHQAVAVTARKWLNGDRAPQGRPTIDGRRGIATWRVDLVRRNTQHHTTEAAA